MSPRSGKFVGKDRAGDEIGPGKVAETGRWWSYNWWFGHWFERNRVGEFRDDDGTPYGQRSRGASAAARERSRLATEYRAYLESRYQAAEAATDGHMVNEAGRRRGVRASSFFTGKRPSMRYASDELRDWFEANGHTLTAAEYRDQGSMLHPYDF